MLRIVAMVNLGEVDRINIINETRQTEPEAEHCKYRWEYGSRKGHVWHYYSDGWIPLATLVLMSIMEGMDDDANMGG